MIKRTIKKFILEQAGSSIILLAIFFTALAGASGMVIDLGAAYIEKSTLQNALDAAALAAAQDLPDTTAARNRAKEYADLNGITLADADITFQNGNKRIIIEHTSTQDNYFLKLFNIASMDIDARAGAEAGGAHPIFDYAMFSGSTTQPLSLIGGGFTIQGSMHGNHNIFLGGGGSHFYGPISAVGNITHGGGGDNMHGNGEYSHSAYEDMPDYTAAIQAAAASAGNIWNHDVTMNPNDPVSPWNWLNYSNESIYVRGNINIVGGNYTGSGSIMADGTITITGGGFNVGGSNQVFIYSRTGDIRWTGGYGNLNAILYAPGHVDSPSQTPKGEIYISGGGINIYGAVVGRIITWHNGSVNVWRDSTPITAVPATGIKLVL